MHSHINLAKSNLLLEETEIYISRPTISILLSIFVGLCLFGILMLLSIYELIINISIDIYNL